MYAIVWTSTIWAKLSSIANKGINFLGEYHEGKITEYCLQVYVIAWGVSLG